MSEKLSDREQHDAGLPAQDLLRGLQSAVDEVFATMLSTLGVGTRLGDPCLLDVERVRGTRHDLEAIRVEARIEIRGPLHGWISLSCTAQAADDLARDLLRLGAGELLSRAEVQDALGECANMVAGVLKTAMLDTRGSYSIGTPCLTTAKGAAARPRGTLAYRLCAGTLNAELWLARRVQPR